MKKMTCKQLGGVCNTEFRAENWGGMSQLSKAHGMQMLAKGDAAHLKAMEEIKDLMTEPKKMNAWMREKEELFNSLPDDK